MEFKRAADLKPPGLTLSPQKQAAALVLYRRAKWVAGFEKKDLAVAVRLFSDAKTLDPSLKFDPNTEAHQLRAKSLVASGRRVAQSGNLQKAVSIFRDAKTLDPSLKFDPDSKAHQLRAETLVSFGRRVARSGKLDLAVRYFSSAKHLNPSLKFDPESKARARKVIAEGRLFAKKGDVGKALAAFAKAREFDPAEVTGDDLNDLCWSGSVANQADAVMQSCEAAVSENPENGGRRDSRGLARALVGNWPGAIEDFEFFIKWAGTPNCPSGGRRCRSASSLLANLTPVITPSPRRYCRS